MSNSNMINPANYYNPFAKYNYVSKTRGVYIPRSPEVTLNGNVNGVEKSSSIFSDNYDAEADLVQAMNEEFPQDGILGFINKFFTKEN